MSVEWADVEGYKIGMEVWASWRIATSTIYSRIQDVLNNGRFENYSKKYSSDLLKDLEKIFKYDAYK